ncbi:MAG TPA: vitamin K epoxide reductase family protein [Thermoplasmata archaeon]|nr:vitamin K epoxide reductase family protein [Thermoplasmata archaeon]
MDARTLHALLPVAIIIGLGLSIFAGYETTHPAAEGACSFNGFVSCAKVDQSAHSSTFGVPDYWAGIAGFLVLLAVDVPLLRTYKPVWLYLVLGLSSLGLIAAVYFAYVELVVIGALCIICTGAYLSNVVVFAAALALYRVTRTESSGGARSPDAVP